MKHRVILLIGVLFGTNAAIQMAHAGPQPPTAHPQWDSQNQGPRSGADLWKAPSETVDPSSLVSDNSTDSTALDGLGQHHLDSSFGPDSFQLVNVFKGDQTEFENAKPIEKLEVRSETPINEPPPAVAPPRRETHRIAIIAFISVALLAFRKFRRPNNGIPPKPSFL